MNLSPAFSFVGDLFLVHSEFRSVGRELALSAVQFSIRPPVYDKTCTGCPVFFVPPFMTTGRVMLPAEVYARVKGHPTAHSTGRSLALDDRHIDRIASEVKSFLKQHSGQKAVLVGHSLGGVLGVMVAQRYPELVSDVITIASPQSTYRHLDEIWSSPVGKVYRFLNTFYLISQRSKASRETELVSFFEAVTHPLPDNMGSTSVIIAGDEVVRPETCLNFGAFLNPAALSTKAPVENLIVRGPSHGAAACHRRTLEILGERLSAIAVGNRQPYVVPYHFRDHVRVIPPGSDPQTLEDLPTVKTSSGLVPRQHRQERASQLVPV